MTTTGPNSPSTVVNDTAVGTIAWSNPGNAAASDDNEAQAAIGGSDITNYLKATNFGFSIPTGDNIDGVKVEIERRGNGANRTKDNIVSLIIGGTVSGNNKASATFWPTTDAYASYGNLIDTWGLSLTPADVNGSNFGVVLSATAVNNNFSQVDHIRITIYHSTPASGIHPAWAANNNQVIA